MNPTKNLSRYVLMCCCFFVLVSVGLSLPQQNRQDSHGIVGVWQGALNVGGTQLRIVFRISAKPDGSLTALMDSPDQGAKDIPVDTVRFENSSVRIVMKAIAGLYEGALLPDQKTIDGTWQQGGVSLPLPLGRTEKPAEVNRPQEPKKPYPYDEEEVQYENVKAQLTLAGTLTLPRTGGSFPAVLLITGSGPEDRDEMVFGHRPFLVLADYLTRLGIAVLRVDDRGVGKSTGKLSGATSEDFASDVLAGVGYLKTRKEINPKKIGLIGHSEGGMIAPMVAGQSKDVAFIVLMAGLGVTGEEILYAQAELIAKADSTTTSEAIAKNRAQQEQIFSILKQEKDTALARMKIRKIVQEAFARMTEEEKRTSGYSESAVDAQLASVLSPWFRYFLTYDPKPNLMKVKCPVLAINGEKDLQVPPKQNLPEIESALKAGKNTRFTIKELRGLNHLFQTSSTGSPSEYAKIEETISPSALKVIGDWILKQTK